MRLILAILISILCTASAFAQPYIGWVQRYNGLANGNDEAIAIAVDNRGNVYVTGSSQGDYTTLKYDSSGNLLWERRFNGVGNGPDVPFAIAVDSMCNVYVTGFVFNGATTHRDFGTVKYDSTGNQLWAAFYDGPEGGGDQARALAVDGNGNVYVAGVTYDTITRIDTKNGYYGTVKYDPNGNQLWARNYFGPGNGGDGVYAIVLDSSNSIYVTGHSLGDTTRFDYATIKYNTNGNELWIARYDGPENGTDAAYAIAADDSGNVYVTGESNERRTGAINPNYATVKYDSLGNQLWAARYGELGDGTDGARDIAIEKNGNIYVTGTSSGSVGTFQDYATIKYDPQGNQLWVARFNAPSNSDDRASAIALDSNQNIYVSGHSWENATRFDYATVKYDSQGNQIWATRYNGPANWIDEVNDLIVDANGNVYVTGFSSGAIGNTDITTIKYSPTPVLKGDLDRSGVLNLGDIALLLNCVFLGLGDCSPAFSDTNCDGFQSPLDVVILLNVFYLSASPPCASENVKLIRMFI